MTTNESNLSDKIEHFINKHALSFDTSHSIPESDIDQAISSIHSKLLQHQQLRLMIKPQEVTIKLCQSIIALLAGYHINLPLTCMHETRWTFIHQYLSIPDVVFQGIQKFKQLVSQKLIKNENYLYSKQYYEEACQYSTTNTSQQQQSIINVLFKQLPIFHSYLYQHSQSKRIPKQIKDLSLVQQTEPDQVQTPIKHNRTNSKLSYLSQKSQKSQKSQLSVSPLSKDLQQRVQKAQKQKFSRLDKIMGLKVKKPAVTAKYQKSIEPVSTKMSDQRLILLEEIENNKQEVKKLKRFEQELKWQVEKEVKYRQRMEEKQRYYDDIQRYRQVHEQNKEIQVSNKTLKRNSSNLKQNSSSKILVRNKENEIFEKEQMKNDQLVIDQLKRELMNAQRSKEQIRESLLKQIGNIQRNDISFDSKVDFEIDETYYQ